MTEGERLYFWTIYQHPRDYPTKFVVVRWWAQAGISRPLRDTDPWYLADTLEQARESIPPGLVLMERSLGDDAVIVESWL